MTKDVPRARDQRGEGGRTHLYPTPRQREVLTLVADGKTDCEIAGALRVSPATVRTHLRRLYAAFGIRSRAQAVAYMLAVRTDDALDPPS